MRQEPDKVKRKTKRQVRRNNAKLYPIYKMFSWDLLFFYAVEFLFYTITKKITAPQVLIVSSIYLFLKIVMQIPAVTISETIGKKKCMILGNVFVAVYIILLITLQGLPGLIFATVFCALGYDMKTISESNLLYEVLPKELLNNIENILGGDLNKISEEIKNRYAKKLKLIPFTSLGKQNGMLIGIKADYVSVFKGEEEKENKFQNIIIGIYPKSLTKKAEYRALIGIELI